MPDVFFLPNIGFNSLRKTVAVKFYNSVTDKKVGIQLEEVIAILRGLALE